MLDILFAEDRVRKDAINNKHKLDSDPKWNRKFQRAHLHYQDKRCQRQSMDCQQSLDKVRTIDQEGRSIIEQKLKNQNQVLDSVKKHLDRAK